MILLVKNVTGSSINRLNLY